MARILLGWELGLGLGHVATLLPVANALAEHGHEPILVMHNLVETWPLLQNSGYTVLQAPIFFARSGYENIVQRTRSYADILADFGYDDVDTLEPMVRAWGNLLDNLKPDLVVAEYAPTLSLASYGRVPVINIGTGFEIAYWDGDHFPVLNETVNERVPLATLDHTIETVLRRLGQKPPKPAVRAVFGEQVFVTVFSEIDPYRETREQTACGPLWSLPPMIPPLPESPMCLVYLPADHPELEKLINGLSTVKMPGIVYIRNANAHILEQLHKTSLTVSTAPLDLDALLPCVSVVLHHGGAGMTQRCLAYGRPQVIAPIHLEQVLTCAALQEMGVAIKLGGAFSTEQSGGAIAQAVRIPRLAQLAQLHAQTLRQRYPHGSLDRVVQACLNSLSMCVAEPLPPSTVTVAKTKPVSIAFVTTCKGRLQHLQQTLPLMIAEQPDEIVVVDYGCPQGTADWIEATYPQKQFPQLTVVRVTDDQGFNVSRARNLGAAVVKADWICFIDADVCVQPGWVNWMRSQLGDIRTYYRSSGTLEGGGHGPEVGGCYGTFILGRNVFEQVKCYDEVFSGWGGEDGELYDRLVSWGFREAGYPQEFVKAITHTNAMRTQFYKEKDKNVTHLAAQYYVAIKATLMQQEGGEVPLAVRQDIMNRVQSQILELTKNQMYTPLVALDFFVRHPMWRVKDKVYDIRQQLVTSIAQKKIKINQSASTKQFCVMTFGRCGSTSLMNSLQQYDDIAVPNKNIDCPNNELLLEDKVAIYMQKYSEIVNETIADPQQLIEHFYAYNSCYGYVGFKSMPNRHPDFKHFISRDDIQFITLIRDDIASTVASFIYAELNGSWGRRGEKHQTTWRFDEKKQGDRVRGYLADGLESYAALRSIPNAIALTYEALCSPQFENKKLDAFFDRHICLDNPKPPTLGSSYVENWKEFEDFIVRARKSIS